MNELHYGFTGTRNGMSEAQARTFRWWLNLAVAMTHFHFGDCVGADDEAACMVHGIFPHVVIVSHPPIDESRRAFNPFATVVKDPREFLARNRAIVRKSQVLLATPREMVRQDRGGTWYTVRCAEQQGKRVILFNPDGTLGAERAVVA